jgi:hypothetical protein
MLKKENDNGLADSHAALPKRNKRERSCDLLTI